MVLSVRRGSWFQPGLGVVEQPPTGVMHGGRTRMGLLAVGDLVGALLTEDVLHRVGCEQLQCGADVRRRCLRPRMHCNTRAC